MKIKHIKRLEISHINDAHDGVVLVATFSSRSLKQMFSNRYSLSGMIFINITRLYDMINYPIFYMNNNSNYEWIMRETHGIYDIPKYFHKNIPVRILLDHLVYDHALKKRFNKIIKEYGIFDNENNDEEENPVLYDVVEENSKEDT